MIDPLKAHAEMMKRVLDAAAPDCISWWELQPLDLFREVMRDLEDILMDARSSEQAMRRALQFAEQELNLCVRFHKKALYWRTFLVKKGQTVAAALEFSPEAIDWMRVEYYEGRYSPVQKVVAKHPSR